MELTNHLLTNVAAGHGPLVCLAAVARCKSVKQWLTEEGMLEEHIEAGAAYLRSTVLREREHIGTWWGVVVGTGAYWYVGAVVVVGNALWGCFVGNAVQQEQGDSMPCIQYNMYTVQHV